MWGSACNMASRMESSAENGSVQISQATVDKLRAWGLCDQYVLHKRRVSLKGIGRVLAYTIETRQSTDADARRK